MIAEPGAVPDDGDDSELPGHSPTIRGSLVAALTQWELSRACDVHGAPISVADHGVVQHTVQAQLRVHLFRKGHPSQAGQKELVSDPGVLAMIDDLVSEHNAKLRTSQPSKVPSPSQVRLMISNHRPMLASP
jgi:hypothetical protein